MKLRFGSARDRYITGDVRLLSLTFQIMAECRRWSKTASRRAQTPRRAPHRQRCNRGSNQIERITSTMLLQKLGNGVVVRCVMCWSAFAIKDLMQAGRWQQIFRSPLDCSLEIRQSHNESFLARLFQSLPCCMMHRIQVRSMADFGIPTSGRPQATWRPSSFLLQFPGTMDELYSCPISRLSCSENE